MGDERESSETTVLKRLRPSPARRGFSPQPGLRQVMAQFATGVTVLTAGGEDAHGMTANAFSSVSLEPPMVLCCVSKAARMHSSIITAGAFGVNILAAGQQDLSKYFADWRRPDGLAQFDAVGWTPGAHTGAPLLNGTLAWLECELAETLEGGDHSIFLGRVVATSRGTGDHALVFYGGGYHEVDGRARAA
ncbi:oxidoreductase [Amycolatopsis mediterranei S699]|uniref:Oxidoreductase n=2 Tax=Amycolatopsis mediterranei TaxID=33910 RepID=A0A9R0P3E2_AMYMS|nr:flavin reductase family protein [Amycolatopsis mediterranei]ADJ48583.1 putative oxidoreductase [Amycolatopsis mediterranei U32]AEK45515.1 oxidoreductase [Amycolatopsis mediterranei S699]AFO80292.1 oxidoreductase [Amycolatopsis mediterranei S699]AGT87420.1 oxidoreductase [Amycolatopsis mediterranei RB]KDO11192.1 flavin reductase [Amycolatopsis mediterranei]